MDKTTLALLAAACLALPSAAAARSCASELDGRDYESLAKSKSRITRQNIEEKATGRQMDILCDTRAFLKKVLSGATVDCGAIPLWSYKYLTEEEFDRLDKVTTRCIVEVLEKKGLAGRGRSS